MRPRIDRSQAIPVVFTASETNCPECQRELAIAQHRTRYVIRLDGVYKNIRKDKRCTQQVCPLAPVLYILWPLRC